MSVLTFDFETRDPSIALKRGAGWVYRDFDILGVAYKTDRDPAEFTTDMAVLQGLIDKASTLVCHNATYDIGCLRRLGIDYETKTIVDTQILAKLYDNTRQKYSLNDLSEDYLGQKKDHAALLEVFPNMSIKKIMSNMREVFAICPEVVARYARMDVELTRLLYDKFMGLLYEDAVALIPTYSDLVKAMVLWRSRGVRFCRNRAEEVRTILLDVETISEAKLYEMCGEINLNSPKQVKEAFLKLGIQVDETTDAAWRKTQDHPAVLLLSEVKNVRKLRRDFIDGILEREEGGLIYPEMNILGAVETGRFTSSNPNIQQIPKRDGDYAKMVRSVFLPYDGCEWASLDFSAQEPRLQVGYASVARCMGADVILQSFLENPRLDLHQRVADLAQITRTAAKTIGLGISYGMGRGKLALSLGLGDKEAKELLAKYNKMVPYLKDLDKKVQASGLAKGYVKTLSGRRLAVEKEFIYKSLNKLIQGSAADQTTKCLVEAYRQGLPVMFSVHDSIELSVSSVEQIQAMRDIMQKDVGLNVPFIADISHGKNWGEC